MALQSSALATLSANLRGLFVRAGSERAGEKKRSGFQAPQDWKGRAAHGAAGLLVVLAVYWVYAAACVPLIEPSLSQRDPERLTARQSQGLNERVSRELAELKPFFPPGAWELTNPKILESDNVKLLMGGYRNLGDGRIRIQPCTIVFLPHGDDPDPQRRARNAVILQAPEGALLRFDQPLNLRRMKIGRLIAGSLEGKITIRSAGREPGGQDDLLITTRSVQLTERSIWTAEPVYFSFGPHHGCGRELRIALIPGPKTGEGQSHGPSVAGVESFELVHLERLHLEFGSPPNSVPGGGFAGQAAGRAAQNPAAPHAPGLARSSSPAPASTALHPAPVGSWAEGPIPVELSCKGPFRFDVSRKVATFEEQVNVWRAVAEGQFDQLECDRLSIFFEEQTPLGGASPGAVAETQPVGDGQATTAGPSNPGEPSGSPMSESQSSSEVPIAGDSSARKPLLRLVPRRIEAVGNPVVLSLPSQQAAGQAQRLEYDFAEKRIVLEAAEHVWLRHRAREIHARSLQYQFAEHGRLGRVVAVGAGWLRAQQNGPTGQAFEARWMDRLLVRPHEQNQVVSLTGGAQISFEGLGRMDAQEVHLWLDELPPATPEGMPRFVPDRLLASQDVRLDSAQLSGRVDQLEVWFEPVAQMDAAAGGPGPSLAPPAVAARPGRVGGAPALDGGQIGAGRLVPVSIPGPADPVASGLEASGTPPPAASPAGRLVPVGGAQPMAGLGQASPRFHLTAWPGAGEESAEVRHFEITGGVLRARVRIGGAAQPELAEVTVEDNVVLQQTPRLQGEQLRVSGQHLHALYPQRPDGVVTLSGNPARLAAQGVELIGSNIHLNRGTNRLWVEGAGRMQFPLARQFDGRPLAPPGVAAVEWQGGLMFDGRAATFEKAVFLQTLIGQAWRQRVWTETLEVRLARPVDFAHPRQPSRPELQQVFCRGGVSVESRDFDPQGQPLSHDRFEAADLAVNLQSGALTAGGPGWLSSVRPAGDEAPWAVSHPEARRPAASDSRSRAGTGPNAPLTQQSNAQAGGSPGDVASKLKCLYVRFQDSVQGDLHHRHLTFLGQVSASYTPARSWLELPDVDRPEQIDPEAVTLHCGRLAVWQMISPIDARRMFEVEALGNPVVEGRTFTARAARISYAEGKDLLVLEGDGLNDAELFYQARVGGATSQAAARRIFFWPRSRRLKVDGARSLELTGFSLPTARQ